MKPKSVERGEKENEMRNKWRRIGIDREEDGSL
jgi:hypothetical protein